MKNELEFALRYFVESEDRWIASLLLLGAAVSTIGFVGLIACISWWSVGFWAALTAMNLSLFLSQLLIYAGIVLGIVLFSYLSELLKGYLGTRWRKWLSERFIGEYIPEPTEEDRNTFVDLHRFPEQIAKPTPQQRIHEDITTYVEMSLDLSVGLLGSVFQLIISIGALWIIGGSLSFMAFGTLITIPGFLVWSALLFACVFSLINHWIGKNLSDTNQNLETKESDLRQELEFIKQQAEFIAQEHGQTYYRNILLQKIEKITKVQMQKLNIDARLKAFTDFYMNLASIFPNLAACPLYFNGQLTLGSFMQIGLLFNLVNNSFSWFITYYPKLARYHNSLNRLLELEKALQPEGLICAPKQIQRSAQQESSEIRLTDLNVSFAQCSDRIFENQNLEFRHGENTLIQGPNGVGKSTFFKVISGTWRHGTGQVSRPKNVMFFAQRPTMPWNTLRAILAYPNTVDCYTDSDYQQALLKVGLQQYHKQLDENKLDWGNALSLGEQQLISFARALLRKPDWLFMDESTASLTEETEKKMYGLLGSTLPNTTLVSIAHRSGVKRFHSRLLRFNKSETSASVTILDDSQALNAANDHTLTNKQHSNSL